MDGRLSRCFNVTSHKNWSLQSTAVRTLNLASFRRFGHRYYMRYFLLFILNYVEGQWGIQKKRENMWKMRPASWSSDQSLCLLIMRSRVRFPVLPWEFSLKGRIPAVTMVWVGLRALLALHPPISHSHHRDNVTAPHGRPKLRSRLHFCHAQEGRPWSPQGHVGALGGKKFGKCVCTPVYFITSSLFIFSS